MRLAACRACALESDNTAFKMPQHTLRGLGCGARIVCALSPGGVVRSLCVDVLPRGMPRCSVLRHVLRIDSRGAAWRACSVAHALRCVSCVVCALIVHALAAICDCMCDQVIRDKVVALAGNEHMSVVATSVCSLYFFSKAGRRILPAILLSAQVCLHVRKSVPKVKLSQIRASARARAALAGGDDAYANVAREEF